MGRWTGQTCLPCHSPIPGAALVRIDRWKPRAACWCRGGRICGALRRGTPSSPARASDGLSIVSKLVSGDCLDLLIARLLISAFRSRNRAGRPSQPRLRTNAKEHRAAPKERLVVSSAKAQKEHVQGIPVRDNAVLCLQPRFKEGWPAVGRASETCRFRVRWSWSPDFVGGRWLDDVAAPHDRSVWRPVCCRRVRWFTRSMTPSPRFTWPADDQLLVPGTNRLLAKV